MALGLLVKEAIVQSAEWRRCQHTQGGLHVLAQGLDSRERQGFGKGVTVTKGMVELLNWIVFLN